MKKLLNQVLEEKELIYQVEREDYIFKDTKTNEGEYTAFIFNKIAIFTKDKGDNNYLVLALSEDAPTWYDYQWEAFWTMISLSLSFEEAIEKTAFEEFTIYNGSQEDIAMEIMEEYYDDVPGWLTDYINYEDLFYRFEVDFDLEELVNEEGYIFIHW